MGNSDSHLHHADHTPHPLAMEPQPMNYPDMNVIFKGIPKMMQVADDMHRMTNYIMDLRNMTIGLTAMTAVGILLFLLLKYYQGKQASRRRRTRNPRNTYHHHNTDSEQSSLSRPGHGDRSSRYSQKHLDWTRQGIDMEKLMEQSQQSSRQTPPHQKPYTINNGNSLGPTSGMPEYQPCPLPAPNFSSQQPNSTPPVPNSLPVHQPNGGLVTKRLDPVKLRVDEVPYADT